MRVVLVTRRGCHLCEEAERLLRELRLEPELRDVDADPGLFDLYDWRGPVVLLDGRVVAEGRVTRTQLAKVLGEVG